MASPNIAVCFCTIRTGTVLYSTYIQIGLESDRNKIFVCVPKDSQFFFFSTISIVMADFFLKRSLVAWYGSGGVCSKHLIMVVLIFYELVLPLLNLSGHVLL